jgi:hypothetical protein
MSSTETGPEDEFQNRVDELFKICQNLLASTANGQTASAADVMPWVKQMLEVIDQMRPPPTIRPGAYVTILNTDPADERTCPIPPKE